MNLCVALANAYITPLPASVDEATTETVAAPQQPSPVGKKGAKGEQQPAATGSGPAASSVTAAKNEDMKSALEVNDSLEKKKTNILIDSFLIKVMRICDQSNQ